MRALCEPGACYVCAIYVRACARFIGIAVNCWFSDVLGITVDVTYGRIQSDILIESVKLFALDSRGPFIRN